MTVRPLTTNLWSERCVKTSHTSPNTANSRQPMAFITISYSATIGRHIHSKIRIIWSSCHPILRSWEDSEPITTPFGIISSESSSMTFTPNEQTKHKYQLNSSEQFSWEEWLGLATISLSLINTFIPIHFRLHFSISFSLIYYFYSFVQFVFYWTVFSFGCLF